MNQTNSHNSLADSCMSLLEKEAFYGKIKEIRTILILGYHKVGKTSLATKFLLDFFPESEVKLEEDFCKIIV